MLHGQGMAKVQTKMIMDETLRLRNEMILGFKTQPFKKKYPHFSADYLLALAAVQFSPIETFLRLTATCKLLGGLRVTSEREQEALSERMVAGAALAATESFGNIDQIVPRAMTQELKEQARDGSGFLEEVEKRVFVPLLTAQGRQAKEVFEHMITEALEGDYELAHYSPDEAGQHGTSDRRTLFMAPVKEGARMEAKVSQTKCAYCKAQALRDLVSSIIQQAGHESGGKKGLPGLRNVAAALELEGADTLDLEPLAEACAAKMQIKRSFKRPWPHTQHLGDCLRCTIECPDVQSMLRSWRRLREVFGLREGRGRLNNRLLSSITIDLNVRPASSRTLSPFPRTRLGPLPLLFLSLSGTLVPPLW